MAKVHMGWKRECFSQKVIGLSNRFLFGRHGLLHDRGLRGSNLTFNRRVAAYLIFYLFSAETIKEIVARVGTGFS